MTHSLISERPEDAADINALLDRAFGSERHQKTSYRYRDGVAPAPGLSWVIRDGNALIGTIRYWPVLAGDREILLLGPIAVDPRRQGEGIGATLIFRTLELAVWAGYRLVVLVGERSYYGRFGFRPAKRVRPDDAGRRSRAAVDAAARLRCAPDRHANPCRRVAAGTLHCSTARDGCALVVYFQGRVRRSRGRTVSGRVGLI